MHHTAFAEFDVKFVELKHVDNTMVIEKTEKRDIYWLAMNDEKKKIGMVQTMHAQHT